MTTTELSQDPGLREEQGQFQAGGARAETGITCIDPLVNPLWGELLAQSQSSVFQSREWLRVLTDTYGFKIKAFIRLADDGRPRAGVPFCHIADVRGERIVSLPFSDYCDPLVDDPDDWQRLMGTLSAMRVPIILRPLHNELPLADGRFSLTKQAKWHAVDLRPELDAHWARLPDSARRAIRKARDCGLVVRPARGLDELRTFFTMHLGVRKHKYRLLAQPYSFFQNIWQRFIEPGRGQLSLAVHQDQIVGGVLFLEWQETLYYKFNASAPGDLPHRPNDMLMWEGIRYGKSKNLVSMDLGLSDWDQDGLIRYKRKYATEEKTISFLHLASSCDQPLTEIGELLGRMTELLTGSSVPDEVTEQAGAAFYRYFA